MYAVIMGNYARAVLPINYIEKPKSFSFLYLLQITSKYIYFDDASGVQQPES